MVKAIVVGKDLPLPATARAPSLLRTFAELFDFEMVLAGLDQAPGARRDGSAARVSGAGRSRQSGGRPAPAGPLLPDPRNRGTTGRNRGGRLLGFPTANIILQSMNCAQRRASMPSRSPGKGEAEGVANIGYSPTFDDHLFTVEVHILDFDRDIYGQAIRVNFIRVSVMKSVFPASGTI
jgi:riboflavin kinase/FMN adenylyltransferase